MIDEKDTTKTPTQRVTRMKEIKIKKIENVDKSTGRVNEHDISSFRLLGEGLGTRYITLDYKL